MLDDGRVLASRKNEEILPIDETPGLPQGGDNRSGRSPAKLPWSHKWLVWTILLVFILVSYGPIALGRFAYVESGISTNDTIAFVLLPALSLILMAASALTVHRLARGSVPLIIPLVTRRRRWDVLGAIALPIVVLAGNAIARRVLLALSVPLGSNTLFSTGKPSISFLVTYTFLMVLVTPTVEEIFWRGTIQDGLERVSNGPAACVLQAIMFALLHLRGLGATALLLFLGFVLGAWRWRRRTILPLIIAHVAWNAVFCAGLWRDCLELRKIRITTDYSLPLRELNRPSDFTTEQNALPRYGRAFELLVEMPKGLSRADCKAWPTELAVDKLTLLRNWIHLNQQAIAEFEVATEMPYLCPEYDRVILPNIWCPKLQKEVVPMMSIMLARAQVSSMQGDFGQAVSDIITCYRFGWHLSGPKPALDQLLALAVKDRTLRVVFGVLQRTALDDAALHKLQVELEGISEKRIAPIDFSGQELVVYDLIQRSFTDDGMGRGHMPRATIQQLDSSPPYIRALGRPQSHLERIESWRALERRKTTRLAGEIFAYLESIELASPAERQRLGEDVSQDIRRMARGNAFLLYLTETYGFHYHQSHRCEALMRAVILTTAILRYELNEGDFPSELSDLVQAGYLHRLPLDPYSDAPFIYKRGIDDFQLYSVGPDFDDDGGSRGDPRRIAGGDDVFWPRVDNVGPGEIRDAEK